jgi:hypothetical protein
LKFPKSTNNAHTQQLKHYKPKEVRYAVDANTKSSGEEKLLQ